MRVFEFAKKVGISYAEVVKLAEGKDIEVYSPLSELEADDVNSLNEEVLKISPEERKGKVEAQLAAREKKRAKAQKNAAEKNKKDAKKLEEERQRAIAAHKGLDPATPVKAQTKQAKPKKQVTEIKLELPTMPKVTIDVSHDDEEGEEDVRAPEIEDDEPERMRPKISISVAKKPSKKQEAKKPEPKKPESKKQEQKKPEVKRQDAKPTIRVGGSRAGFSSVSMNTAPKVTASVSVAPVVNVSVSSREISVRGAIVVKELATRLGVRPNRLIADLMGLKVLASINQRVEPEVAAKVAQKYGFKVNIEKARDHANAKPVLKAIDADDEIPQDKPEDMVVRAPVVTFLGHVDHGKTTLMDYIRHTRVAAGEAGGITQAISAYQVDVQGRKITFLDTPGHAAFNAMRQRGAQLTDIAVIIIAADDGIMPQTQEAIKFARQAGVQIMVAITKCDKPTADPMRVKQMLQKEGLTPEDWGGDIVCCEVSGTTGAGVDNLLEMILLQADMLELTANPKRRANGYVIEAELEQGFGPSAMVLVTGGTLKVGDAVLIGEYFGKIRSLIDDHGRRIKEAPPATPVKCTGLSGVPEAGAEFRVMLDEKRARTLAEEAARVRKEEELSQTKAASLDDLLSKMGADGKRELSVVVKADTQGSLEAIVGALNEIKSQKVSLKIIDTGTGNVSLTDVKSAAAGKAIIVGFDVGCDSGVQGQARHDSVRINSFRIIYELLDHVKKSMLDLLPPEYKEVTKGHAIIKAIYDISKLGKIAGSQMLDGSLLANGSYRIYRGKNNEVVWQGKLQSLRHFKDEVKEVTGQQECGVCFANFEGFAEGDTIECYVLEELPRSL